MSPVVSNILDKIHETLPVDIWDHVNSHEPKLKAQHAKWIRTTVEHVLADAGYTHMREWLSLVLTGSLTTFQYDKHSDCDVSLFVDVERFPEWSRAEMIAVMVDKLDGTILPGTPYQMQCFVVPSDVTKEDLYQPGLRSGWDIDKHEWIEPPDPTRVHDVEKEMNASYAYALEQADKMERLLRYEPDKAITFWHQIHRRRKRDHQAGKGDYSDSNIVYKFLANRGLMPRIAEVSGEYIARRESLHDSSNIKGHISQPRFEGDQGQDLLSRLQTPLSLDRGGEMPTPRESGHIRSAHMPRPDLGSKPASADVYEQFEQQFSSLDSSDTIAGHIQANEDFSYDTPFGTGDSSFDSSRSHQGTYQADIENKSSQSLEPVSGEFEAFPIISEISGEYIAKTAKPQKQVAKFAYDPIDNHLAVGKMANEEGATESHAGIVRQVGMDHTKPLMFGQIGDNGHVEVFARPGITGYGKVPLNPKEIDWRMKRAVKHAVPEAQFAKGLHDNLTSPRWEERWTEPHVQFLHDRPVINATDEQPPEENDIDFERF